MAPFDRFHSAAIPLVELCSQQLSNIPGFAGAYLFGKETSPWFSPESSDADLLLILDEATAASAIQRADAVERATELMVRINTQIHQLGYLVEKDLVATILTPLEVKLDAAQGNNLFFQQNDYWNLQRREWEKIACDSARLSSAITKTLTRLQTFRSTATKGGLRAIRHEDLFEKCKDLFRSTAIAYGEMTQHRDQIVGKQKYVKLLRQAAQRNPDLQSLADGVEAVDAQRKNPPMSRFLPRDQLILSEVLFDVVVMLTLNKKAKKGAAKKKISTRSSSSGNLEELLERFLRDVGDTWIQQWTKYCNTDGGPSPYLCNHLAIPKSAAKSGEKGRTEGERGDAVRQDEPLVTAPNPTEAQTLKAFFEHGKKTRRWLVTEDAGAGKSVFTRRLQAWFCEGGPDGGQTLLGKSALVVRWEGGGMPGRRCKTERRRPPPIEHISHPLWPKTCKMGTLKIETVSTPSTFRNSSTSPGNSAGWSC